MPGAEFPARQLLEFVLARRKEIAAGLAAAACGVYLGFWLPQAYRNWAERTSVREVARKARKSGITYVQALRDPSAIFKPVHWFLTHPVPGQWYHDGNPSEPVVWAGPEPDLPFTGQSGAQNSLEVLAIIQGADAKKGVSLSFVGRE